MKFAQRWGLVALGLVAVVTGLATTFRLLRDTINQAQGKCDYAPCVFPWTVPTLVAFALLAVIGAALAIWSIVRRRQ